MGAQCCAWGEAPRQGGGCFGQPMVSRGREVNREWAEWECQVPPREQGICPAVWEDPAAPPKNLRLTPGVSKLHVVTLARSPERDARSLPRDTGASYQVGWGALTDRPQADGSGGEVG